ncbi:MAG: hypothetical protein K6T83_24000 [Alicyclobacillus sp.]|nr:hypothetical protein [Alicyclobacillus sp.]
MKTEATNGQAVITNPTLDEWRRLYEAAIAFRDLAPWNWMFEDQIFAVENPENGEVGYCSVMGAGGAFHALCVYRGEEGLLSYERMRRQSDDGPIDTDLFLDQRSLVASFEGREDVDKRDRQVFQSLGLRFRGKYSWPVLRSREPGCVPWYLTAGECRFLTCTLEQAVVVAQRIKENPDLLDEKPGCILTRVCMGADQTGEWTDQWPAWPYIEDDTEDAWMYTVSPFIEKRFERAMRTGKPSGAWEVDISYAQFVIEEGERPYFPRMMLCVHHESGMILTGYVADYAARPSEFVEQFVNAMEQFNIYPELIAVSRPHVRQLLMSVANVIGADVLTANCLPGIDQAKQSMVEFMDETRG